MAKLPVPLYKKVENTKVAPSYPVEYDSRNPYYPIVETLWFAESEIRYFSKRSMRNYKVGAFDRQKLSREGNQLYYQITDDLDYLQFSIRPEMSIKEAGWTLSAKLNIKSYNFSDYGYVLSLRRISLFIEEDGNFHVNFTDTGGSTNVSVDTGVAVAPYLNAPHIFTLRNPPGHNDVFFDIDNIRVGNVSNPVGYATDNTYARIHWNNAGRSVVMDATWLIFTSTYSHFDVWVIRNLLDAPYQILKPKSKDIIFLGEDEPAPSIEGSGNLAAQKALLSGSGLVKFDITGSGDLLTQQANLVGSGKAFFEAQGAGQLAVKQALLSGTGTAFSVISGEGGLTTKLVELLGEGSAFTPTSEILGTGDLLTALTELSGSGIVLETVRGSGDLSTEQAILDGSGQVSYEPVTIEGAGQLTLLKTQLDGSGRVLETIIGTGELATALTELSGSGVLTGLVTGSGNFTVPTAVMLGTGVVNSTIIGDGDLQVQMPVLKGYGGEALVRVTEIHFTLAIKKEHVSTLSIRKEVP